MGKSYLCASVNDPSKWSALKARFEWVEARSTVEELAVAFWASTGQRTGEYPGMVYLMDREGNVKIYKVEVTAHES